MRKQILLIGVLWATFLNAQSNIQLHLMTHNEILESAQVLGKMVFEDKKLKIYDTKGQLIAEPNWTEESTIEVNPQTCSVTISNGEGGQQTIDIDMGIDNLQVGATISIDGNMLTIKGVKDGTKFLLFNMNGLLLKQGVANGESTYISVAEIPYGSYILVVNNNFIKILKQ